MISDRVLYQGRSEPAMFEICVTTKWCIANGTRYPIAGLTVLSSSRGRRDLRRGRKLTGLVVVLVVLILTVIAVRTGWTRQIWIALGATAVATVTVTALPAVLGAALRRPYQIWARHLGEPVLLFVTDDSEQFGQVARALVRAHELARD